MQSALRRALALAFCLFPSAAIAQSITTTPATAVPVGSPWLLLAFGLTLIGGMYWMLHRGTLADPRARMIALVLGAALGGAFVLHAQAALTFTNPEGETLSIPITPEISGDDVVGWEPVDFTNNSGVTLAIESVDEPTLSECFPGGLEGELISGSSDASPHPLCAAGDTLDDGATCRVDVETICRAAADGNLANLTAIAATSGSASGGTPVTLTGTQLTGATSVTFDGVAATAVNVVSPTTITAVTPAHAAGVVDVVVSTPNGSSTLANGFTYEVTAIGQRAHGGIIGSLNGGLNNLIVALENDPTAAWWGPRVITIGPGAQSTTDGASNTAATVAVLGDNGGTPYAAGICSAYEIDSQGNTPCQAGNACYDDWFLPAGNNVTATGQLNALYVNRAAIGGFTNTAYWSSTESNVFGDLGWFQSFFNGNENPNQKDGLWGTIRCVRAFTPF